MIAFRSNLHFHSSAIWGNGFTKENEHFYDFFAVFHIYKNIGMNKYPEIKINFLSETTLKLGSYSRSIELVFAHYCRSLFFTQRLKSVHTSSKIRSFLIASSWKPKSICHKMLGMQW